MGEQTEHSGHPAYDVAVVGAGSAGLQAALTLGRMRQRVVVFGTGRYRNDPTEEMHNVLGHDGEHPSAWRDAARADLARYATVDLREAAVTKLAGSVGDFALATEDGQVTARRVVLATGVRDELPDIAGLADLFGAEVAHCPYCHGFEYADTPVGILGAAPHVPVMARLFDPIASRVVVLTDGAQPDADTGAALERDGREVVTAPVASVARAAHGLTVTLEDGSEVALGGMLVKPDWRLAAPHAEQLGLERSEVGAVTVDPMGRTSVPGVYAAGDMAQPPGLPQPMFSVLAAAASGQLAAAGAHQDSLMG
ncbi:NAD(P)/FAD-dependent oxidoreductase [Nocardioides panacisoli]|uniref:NAD(P)/FAD-dependent oxidoreductase n=1 Tax=Nocardioides panacisoli TaxID=627624 RepID=UPI001C625C29|nr:NAD(P)/FAD-dependent oxidoreductase [Nocardioides panacisoli]QYJ03424.1 NAD(P)/FAD-dependent oxidoreductase [Nocardioides panacisoli]